MNHLLRIAAICSAVAGLALAIPSVTDLALAGSVATGQGSTIQETWHASAPLKDDATFAAVSAAITPENIIAGKNLILGFLLVLLGFVFHALLLSNQSEERPVKVTAVRSTKRRNQPKFFWMEIQI